MLKKLLLIQANFEHFQRGKKICWLHQRCVSTSEQPSGLQTANSSFPTRHACVRVRRQACMHVRWVERLAKGNAAFTGSLSTEICSWGCHWNTSVAFHSLPGWGPTRAATVLLSSAHTRLDRSACHGGQDSTFFARSCLEILTANCSQFMLREFKSLCKSGSFNDNTENIF